MWLVVAAALTVTLTSCSDDDDNNTSGSDKITYSADIEVSDDVLSLATVNLQEYGNSGLGAATVDKNQVRLVEDHHFLSRQGGSGT